MNARVLPSASLLAALGALGCMLLTAAAAILGRIAFKITGAVDIFAWSSPAELAVMADYWGLFLAAQIVRVVLGATFLVTAWALYPGLPVRTAAGRVALAIATVGGALFILGSRMGIAAAAKLNQGEVPATIWHWVTLAGLAGILLWALLLAAEGRRTGTLPRWGQGAALVLVAATAMVLIWPAAIIAIAVAGLVWWAALIPPLLGARG